MHSSLIFLLLLGQSCVPVGVSKLPLPQLDAATLQVARSQIATGDLSGADLTLQSLIQQNERDAEAWLELGSLQMQLHNSTAAEISMRRSLSLAPADARAHFTLGLALIADARNKVDWPNAIVEFCKAIQLEPNYPEALTYLGVGLIATGEPARGLAALQQSLAANPDSATTNFNLGLAYEAAGHTTQATAAYQRAAALRVPYPAANSALGKLEARTGDLSGAEKQLRTALAADPDLQDVHQSLGRILRSTHRVDEANVEFTEASTLDQRQRDRVAASQMSNEALKQAAEGNLKDAAKTLRQAILLSPDNGVPHNNLGLVLADLGDLSDAVRELSIAVSLMPTEGRAYLDLGRVLLLQNRTEEAGSCLRWAKRFLPSDPHVLDELSRLPPQTVTHPVVRPSFGASVESSSSHQLFALELDREGDLPGEAGELLHALALSPASVPARLQLAKVYLLLGDRQKANLEARKVLFIDPNSAQARSYGTATAPKQPD